MGTNFYRLPTASEMVTRKLNLINDISNLDLSVSSIGDNFSVPIEDSWDYINPWEKFNDGINIHLGKRSAGWKFCWNFNENKYYSNKEELLSFIRSGRIMDEYGEELNVEEFITMALDWGEPDGLVYNGAYDKMMIEKHQNHYSLHEKHYDKIIDGLRVSQSTDFS